MSPTTNRLTLEARSVHQAPDLARDLAIRMPLGGLPGKGAEALLVLMRQLAQRPRDLLKLLHRQIWVALLVAACLEEEGGVQHGVHEVLVHARGRYRAATRSVACASVGEYTSTPESRRRRTVTRRVPRGPRWRVRLPLRRGPGPGHACSTAASRPAGPCTGRGHWHLEHRGERRCPTPPGWLRPRRKPCPVHD